MNKLFNTATFVATFFFISTVYAQEIEDGRGLYTGISYTDWKASFSDNDGSVTKSGITLKLGYDFDQLWAVEGRLNFPGYKETFKDVDGSGKVKLSTPLGLYGKYRYAINETVAPYIVAGVVQNRYKFVYRSGSDKISISKNTINASAGAGLEVKLASSLKATFELTYLGRQKGDDGSYYDSSAVSAGLLYKF